MKNEWIYGLCYGVTGLVFLFLAINTNTVFTSLFWGFCGAFLSIGLGRIIRLVYWSDPKRSQRYQELEELKQIEQHDELNNKLRNQSGRIAYLIGLFVICISIVVFSFLGQAGLLMDAKIFVFYLAGYLFFQIVVGIIVFYHLLKKY